MSTSIRSIISAAMIATIAISTLLVSPNAQAETVSQCRERAYRQYDTLVASGVPEAEARKVLAQSLKRCNRK